MKNIYELSTKDKDRYRGEFNKLKFTKDVNVVRGPALFVAIFSLIASTILSELLSEGMKIEAWLDFINSIGIIAFGLFVIFTIYLDIAFIRWMKIKHDVEY